MARVILPRDRLGIFQNDGEAVRTFSGGHHDEPPLGQLHLAAPTADSRVVAFRVAKCLPVANRRVELRDREETMTAFRGPRVECRDVEGLCTAAATISSEHYQHIQESVAVRTHQAPVAALLTISQPQ